MQVNSRGIESCGYLTQSCGDLTTARQTLDAYIVSLTQESLRFAFGAFGLFAAFAVATVALAQPWPVHTVRIVATSPPGGSVDFLARTLAEDFGQSYGVPFVVENRPGEFVAFLRADSAKWADIIRRSGVKLE